MLANQMSTPIGAKELKVVIYQKIGRQRADSYFDLLKRFISLELKKNEFDKSCVRMIGKKNVYLHNQLIRTILQNSCVGEVPHSRAENAAVVASPNVKVANGLSVNSRSLRSVMIILEKKLEKEGLKISVDGANVVNTGLDCYLKTIIEYCMKECPQQIIGQKTTALNGMLPASGIYLPKPSNSVYASLSDFGVNGINPLHTWR